MAKKKFKQYMQPIALPEIPSAGLLILRLIVGTAFTLIGSGKIQNATSWMGPQSTVPGFFQFLAAFSEFFGGIALLLGLLTPLAALGIGFTMFVAVYFHKFVFNDPFINPTGGGSYQPALVYLGISILLITLGAGKFSLDRKLFGERLK